MRCMYAFVLYFKIHRVQWDDELILKATQMHFIIKISILVNTMDFSFKTSYEIKIMQIPLKSFKISFTYAVVSHHIFLPLLDKHRLFLHYS